MTDDLKSKVSRWLRETGYPFEMQTVRLLIAGFPSVPWDVSSNVEVEAYPSNDLREIDILVQGSGPAGTSRSIEWTAIVECKSTVEPWVVFRNDLSAQRASALFDVRSRTQTRMEGSDPEIAWSPRLALRRQIEKHCPHWEPECYGIAQCFKDPKRPDLAYGSLRKLVDLIRHYRTTPADFGDIPVMQMFAGILLTTSPLFVASLAADSDLSRDTPLVTCGG